MTDDARDAIHPPALDCEAVVRRLWAYLDGALDDAEQRAVEAHLAECVHCPPHFAFERAFLHAIAATRVEPGDRSALRARVLDALATEGFVRG
jgi:anti-sigma factor RsiW